MNQGLLSKALLLVVLVAATISLQTRAVSAQSTDQESVKIELSELEKTIQLLENPEEAKKLAGQLRALLDAQKQLTPRKDITTEKIEIPSNLFTAYEAYKAQLVATFRDVVEEVKSFPLSYEGARQYLSKEENWQQLMSFAIRFALAFIVAFIIWMVFRSFTKRLQRKIEWREPFSLWKKTGIMLISTSLRIYPWVGLYLFGYVFFLTVPVSEKFKTIVLYELLALALYSALKNLIYYSLSPKRGERRVIPINDELSRATYIGFRRLLRFSLLMFLIIIPSSILQRVALESALLGIYRVGFVLLLAVILARWKETLRQTVCLVVREEDPYWKKRLRTLCNQMAGKLYLIIIFYLTLIVILPILGFPNIYEYLLYSTGKSVIAVVVFIGAWILWDLLMKRLIRFSGSVKEKYGELEGRLISSVDFLGKTVRVVLVTLGVVTILDIWGLQIHEFIASNASLAQRIIRIPLVVLAAVFLIRIGEFLIAGLQKKVTAQMLASNKVSPLEVEKRVATLGRIIRKVTVFAVITVAIMMILEELGFDIKPILAGAGILGLAVGFGAQNLVKDIISGLFLIVENRIRVGDVAIINGTTGLVEQVNPRTTVLRSPDGTIHVFPNGTIDTLSNMTYEFAYYVFEVGVAYKEDVDRVMEVLKELGSEIMQEEEYGSLILEPIEVLGVDQLADSAVIIKARIKTIPVKQWYVGREMNRRIKKRFDELNIEIPFPHTSIYFGDASKPFSVKLEGIGENREELKGLIREVLEEKTPSGKE